MTARERILALALEYIEKPRHPDEAARALYHGTAQGLLMALYELDQDLPQEAA